MGRKHGKGKIIWANGDQFEGNFVNDLRDGMRAFYLSPPPLFLTLRFPIQGVGVFKCVDGSMYEGEWKDDQYHGRGKQISKIGGTYEGDPSLFNPPRTLFV